jgi:hypothetical protein
MMAALISWIVGSSLTFGQDALLSGFEHSLSSTAGASWAGDWVVNPDYTATGATEGSFALAVHHSPTWNTGGTVLRGG